MDERKYSSMTDAVADVPDPRKRRGQRHPWGLILTLISAALVCEQRTGRAIGQWVTEHTTELQQELGLPAQPLPSTATLRRALRSLDVTALEARLTQFTQDLPVPPRRHPTATTRAKRWMGKPCVARRRRGPRSIS